MVSYGQPDPPTGVEHAIAGDGASGPTRSGATRQVFESSTAGFVERSVARYSVSLDRQRILAPQPLPRPPITGLTVVFNWLFEELKQRVPTGGR